MADKKNSIARQFFAKRLAMLERKREQVAGRPLTSKEITTLLSLHKNREPVYPSIDSFYSEEYKETLRTNSSVEKIQRYRTATPEEANLLYCDIHSKEIT